MSEQQNKALFTRFLDELANQKNLRVVDEMVAADFIEHEALPPSVPRGREGVKLVFGEWGKGFPDGHVTLEYMVAEGDLVVGYQTWRGTHTGDYLGVPASGKTVEFKVVDIARIRDGKIEEHWGVTDSLTMMQQIGAVPEAEIAGL